MSFSWGSRCGSPVISRWPWPPAREDARRCAMDNRHAARRPRFLPIAASLSLLVAGACAAAVKEPVGHVPSADVSTIVIVDLSHTLTPGFPYIPVQGVTFPFKSTPIATLEKMGVAA